MNLKETVGDRHYEKHKPNCAECSNDGYKVPLTHYKVEVNNHFIDLYECSEKGTLFGFDYEFKDNVVSFNLPVLIKLNEDDLELIENAPVYDEKGLRSKKMEDLIDKING